jgi:hypothetical protein
MNVIFVLLAIASCVHPLFGMQRSTTCFLAFVFACLGGIGFIIGGPLSFLTKSGNTVPICGVIMLAASIFILMLDEARGE